MPLSRKARHFWPLALVLFLTDCTTKDLIVRALGEDAGPHPLVASLVRLTLIYNPGTAYGFDLRPYVGSSARWILVSSMLLLLAALLAVYRRANPRSRAAGVALGLACGGALGNIYDRIRFPAGVVDFIDVGIGAHRFWIFNVADAGITVGGVLLALILLREDMERART